MEWDFFGVWVGRLGGVVVGGGWCWGSGIPRVIPYELCHAAASLVV